jgi:large subunit ribosomal protein L22
MTGPKLNEGSFVVGERSGTKASAKYVRSSASKVRVVLNLIRGLPVRNADEVLQFTDREAARLVRKVLASAVANASDMNSGAYVADAEELYVKACFADEGPTLKRFTPRARGRAGRINKRTAHITVVVDRLDDDRLDVVQAREARRTAAGRRRVAAGGSAASRRARVERSRDRAQTLKSGETSEATETEVLDDQLEADEADTVVVDTDVVDTTEASVIETQVEGAEGSASDEAQSDAGESEADAKEDK